MKRLQVIVEYAGDNLSAFINDLPIVAVGKNLNDIRRDVIEAIQVYKESCAELGVEISDIVKSEYELSFVIDATTFINYYSNIFTKAALSRITGINERQLWHYAAGLHKPRKRQLERIQRGVQSLTEELNSICLL
jgi:hypothetical protein